MSPQTPSRTTLPPLLRTPVSDFVRESLSGQEILRLARGCNPHGLPELQNEISLRRRLDLKSRRSSDSRRFQGRCSAALAAGHQQGAVAVESSVSSRAPQEL